jgi:hypothetical protein
MPGLRQLDLGAMFVTRTQCARARSVSPITYSLFYTGNLHYCNWPTLPTSAVHKVASYLGYTGRAANVVAKAAPEA